MLEFSRYIALAFFTGLLLIPESASAAPPSGPCYDVPRSTLARIHKAVAKGADGRAEVLRIIEQAAADKRASAEYMLGILYYSGRGVPRNYKRALSLYRQSVKDGCLDAYLDLGFMYQQGNGVERNFTEAMKMYKNAYTKGTTHAQQAAAYAIGGLYLNGLGISKDIDKAKAWYHRSSKLGYQPAKAILRQLDSSIYPTG